MYVCIPASEQLSCADRRRLRTVSVQQLSRLVPWLASHDVHFHRCDVDIANASTHEVDTHVEDASLMLPW